MINRRSFLKSFAALASGLLGWKTSVLKPKPMGDSAAIRLGSDSIDLEALARGTERKTSKTDLGRPPGGGAWIDLPWWGALSWWQPPVNPNHPLAKGLVGVGLPDGQGGLDWWHRRTDDSEWEHEHIGG